MNSRSKLWAGFLGMGLGFAMVYLDQSALNVALPTIQKDLGANETQLFWIINSYLLPLAVCGLGSGRLGDMFGLRKVYLIGLSIFTLASAGCGLAHSPGTLILFRALQGVGGAVIPVIIAACIYHLFPEGKRGKPMGAIGFMASVTILIGPILGGLLTQKVTWRWIFWINPILGVLSYFLVFRFTRQLDQKEKGTSFDFLGSLLFFAFLVPLIIALMQGERWGWGSSMIIILLAAGTLCLPIFIWYEKKIKHPLFDFKLMKNLNFSIACFIFFCGQFAFIATIFVALYLVYSLGKTPTEAGLGLMPAAIVAGIMNPIAGMLTDKIGYRKQIQLGLTGAMISYLLLSITAHTLSYFWVFIALVINGFSISTFFMSTYAMIIHSTPKAQQGMAAGMGATCRQVGASFGMSLIGIIVLVIKGISPATLTYGQKYARGFAVGMAFVSFVMAFGLISSIWIDRRKARYDATDADEIPT